MIPLNNREEPQIDPFVCFGSTYKFTVSLPPPFKIPQNGKRACRTVFLSPAASSIPPVSRPAPTGQVTELCLPAIGRWAWGREVTAAGATLCQDLRHKDGSRLSLIFTATWQTELTLGSHAASALCSLPLPPPPTFTSDEQGELSGVRLSAGSYEHDDLIMCVFGNVSTVDEDDQVSLQEFGLTSTCLQTSKDHLLQFYLYLCKYQTRNNRKAKLGLFNILWGPNDMGFLVDDPDSNIWRKKLANTKYWLIYIKINMFV